MTSLWEGAFDGPSLKRCTAEDVIRQQIPCSPVEGKLDGKSQFYCSHCGRKMNPPDPGGM